ncbi:MAG: hypothetical protein GY798_25260 [Hyphomicrobiales bacterium]|nr:hypothetical protein [Hyphomicrobiales bacterium]
MTDFISKDASELIGYNDSEIELEDVINGNVGNAEKLGSRGNDMLKGGGGADNLYGGKGTHIGSHIHSEELVRITSRMYTDQSPGMSSLTTTPKPGSTNIAAMTSSEAFLAMMS